MAVDTSKYPIKSYFLGVVFDSEVILEYNAAHSLWLIHMEEIDHYMNKEGQFFYLLGSATYRAGQQWWESCAFNTPEEAIKIWEKIKKKESFTIA